ncbi:unnamed protein product [Trichobilharzia regenti]|nr:unnamed protein product [Trichobilharzia regenti]
MLSSYFTNKDATPWALQVFILPGSILSVNWGPLSNEGTKYIQVHDNSIALITDQWNVIEITVNLKNHEIYTNLINNNRHGIQHKSEANIPSVITTTTADTFKSRALQKFIGFMFGQASQLQLTIEPGVTYSLKDFHLESPDTVKRRTPRRLNNLFDDIPTNPIKYISSVNFPEGSFVRYDFRNRLQRTVEEEVLTVNFTIPYGVTSGLLWFSEGEQSKSYVYIKNSLLYYIYAITDKTGKAQRTVTEEIFLNSTLIPEKPQVLQLIRDRDNVSRTLLLLLFLLLLWCHMKGLMYIHLFS